MNTNKAIIVAMAAILIITAVIIGFVAVDNRPEQIHPHGPMTGVYGQLHPLGHEIPGVWAIPLDDIIFIPAYPGDECPAGDRVLIDTPVRVIDTDGTVYWHWFYENRTMARNRTATLPECGR